MKRRTRHGSRFAAARIGLFVAATGATACARDTSAQSINTQHEEPSGSFDLLDAGSFADGDASRNSDAPVDPSHDEPSPDTPADASALLGHWRMHSKANDCIDRDDWHSFAEGGRYTARQVDQNECTGTELLQTTDGSFSVAGQELTLNTPFSVDVNSEDVLGYRTERFSYVLVQNGESEELVRDAYLRVDDQTWRRMTSVQVSAGEFAAGDEVEVTYHFAAPIPMTGDGECQFSVSVSLHQSSTIDDIDERHSAELFSAPCRIDNINSLRRVRFAGLNGDLSSEDERIWQEYLSESHDESAHPAWVWSLLRDHDLSTLYRQASRTDYFSNEPIGTWTRSFADPPED